jgi:outer membrane protein assembly factor BamB
VLLAEDGPKVIDFGISRPKDSELHTETGKLIGTPPFMAPEQFRRPREVGPAADIFALGSVLVHAATGRGPFDSDSPYVVAYQVVHDEPDLTGLPENLAPLVLRCLAKEPEDRPTPDELMRELRSVSASYDTQAYIPAQRAGATPVPEPRKKEPAQSERRRGRRLGKRIALGVGALGLAAIGTVASLQLSDAGDTPPKGTTPHATSSAGFGGWQATPVSKKSTPQCSYGAGKLLCAQPGVVFALDPSDGRVLWRHSVATTHRSGPPVLSSGLVQPSLDSGRRLEALDPASGKARWQKTVPAYTGLADAGGMLLLTHADGTVTAVDSASGATRWSHRIPGQQAPYFTSFTGDPSAYATNTSDDGATTRVTAVDPDTGAVRWDALLKGTLKPVGTAGGSVYLLSVDTVYASAKAVVRYTPDTGASRRVTLPLALDQGHGTVRGNVVYVMGAGGSLVAVNMDARKQLWSLETAVVRGSTPVTDGRQVYITSADGRLLAVDARAGKLVGQTPARLDSNSDQVSAALPEPVVANDRVYAAAPDGTVFAVNSLKPGAW